MMLPWQQSDFISATRIKLALFFDAPDADRVIFTANATDGLNTALLGILKPGDHVITTRLEQQLRSSSPLLSATK